MPQNSFDVSAIHTVPGGLTSIQTNLHPNFTDEMLIAAAVAFASGQSVGLAPDVGWVAPGGIQTVWWKVFATPSPQTIIQTLSRAGSINGSQLVAVFKLKPLTTPVWTLRASGSGGTDLACPAFTPTAGNSLFWLVSAQSNPGNTSITNPGADFQLLANFGVTDNVNLQGSNLILWYAENVAAQSIAPTLHVPPFGGGTWTLYELSGILALSSLRLLT